MPANLSVAMATYNGAAYLRQQLDSFARQTRLPDELVVSDDNSIDATHAIVEDFARTAPFSVRLEVNAERLGYNRNFERAIALCTGEVVFVSDQDDEWFAHKIATVMAIFADRPNLLAVTNDQLIADPQGRITDTTVLGNVRAGGYGELDYGPGCCTALARPAVEILKPFAGNAVPYDHWINIIPALLGGRALCEQPLQSYRRHASNATGSLFAREGVTDVTRAASALALDTREAYRTRIAGNGIIAERLRERAAEIAALGYSVEPALAALDAENAAYGARLEALGKPRMARLPLVLRMLGDGTYRRFRGLKSAAKDLVA